MSLYKNLYEDNGRRTGRTTNLVEHALRLNAAGRPVYIQCGNLAGVTHIGDMLKRISLEKYGRLPPASIKLGTWASGRVDFDESSGRAWLNGGDPRRCVLFDHFAMALKFSGVLDRYHRYDFPVPEGKDEEFAL